MSLPFRVGLKLHSTNVDLIAEVFKLWKHNVFQYIELYVIPESFLETINHWKACNIPFVIHAPHSFHGMNLAVRSLQKGNFDRFAEAQRFANELNADGIIIHGGHSGSIHETIRQAAMLSDSRLMLENKPKVGIKNEECVGWSPEEFEVVMDSGVFNGFVLDFCHAACAAFSLGKKAMEMVKGFKAFKPGIFHLSDGNAQSEKDEHMNLGKGTLPLREFVQVITENSCVTIETPRSPERGLEEFLEDVRILEMAVNQSGRRT